MTTSKPLASMSSRALTRENGTFTRVTEMNRSLQRGLQLLRAFGHGAELLGNGELAVRTGLPLSTVSRLTNTLVQEGFLDYDIPRHGYRLAAIVLSLADTYSSNEHAANAAFPLIKALAEAERINVGLAVANHLEMIYVVSMRESRRGVFRRGVAGSRFPMEPTAGGRSYIAGLNPTARRAVMDQLRQKHGNQWNAVRADIERAIADIEARSFCVAYWAPGMTAIGTPIVAPGGRAYSLIASYHSMDTPKSAESKYGRLLLGLRTQILDCWNDQARLVTP